jgi:excisionase family DNA binding protein
VKGTDLAVTLTADELAALVRREVSAALREQSPANAIPVAVLTLDEAAAFLKISAEALRKRAQKAQVPCFKIGTDWRFRVADLESYLDSLQPKRAS